MLRCVHYSARYSAILRLRTYGTGLTGTATSGLGRYWVHAVYKRGSTATWTCFQFCFRYGKTWQTIKLVKSVSGPVIDA